jgi:hypothetical protein
MGNLLSSGQSAGPDYGGVPAPKEESFGDKLGGFLKDRFPVAGGLADLVIGGGHHTAPDGVQPVGPASAPLPNMPQQQMPDYSDIIAQNAQPKQSGGLQTILKLLMAGG